jgi:hypothetical protein
VPDSAAAGDAGVKAAAAAAGGMAGACWCDLAGRLESVLLLLLRKLLNVCMSECYSVAVLLLYQPAAQ